MHNIIKALKESFELKELPASEVELLQKILADNLITLRAQQLMIEHFAAEAIRQLHPVERPAFLKRISPPPKPLYKVLWEVKGGLHTGRPHIHGACGQCGQDVNFTGDPEQAPGVVWTHCPLGPSKIPESVIQVYETKHGLIL
jgi:hypothetical protein